jgi:hypothetical protein
MKLTNQQIEALAAKAIQKAITHIQKELGVKSQTVYGSFARNTDAIFRANTILSDYIAKEVQEGNVTEKKDKTIVTKEMVDQLYINSMGAYSQDTYHSWRAVCAMLLKRGYTLDQAEVILRSKYTRWAGDASQAKYGKYTAKDLERYLDKCGPGELESLFNEV